MRQPKPFYRKQTKSWYVQIRKRQINLGRDKEAAWKKYHELMLDQSEPDEVDYVVELLDLYLEWLKKNRSEGTYLKALGYLKQFIGFVGRKLRTDQLTPRKVSQWIEEKVTWGPTTSNDAISVVQRAFNWGINNQLIQKNPISRIADKPARQRREVVYTTDEWLEIRGLVTDRFGDLIDVLWETGCRPIEARSIEARHVDLANDLVHFPPSESKGKRTDRVIFLTEKAKSILKRNMHRVGPLLVNTNGNPWTKDSINCRFQRLSKKLGKRLCAYAIRHSYATEGLKSGMDSLILAQLMGHADTTMLARTYSHLARNPDFLRKQAKLLRENKVS